MQSGQPDREPIDAGNVGTLNVYGIGFSELLIIALVTLVLFGHRLPKVMRDLGRGLSEFRRGFYGDDRS